MTHNREKKNDSVAKSTVDQVMGNKLSNRYSARGFNIIKPANDGY